MDLVFPSDTHPACDLYTVVDDVQAVSADVRLRNARQPRSIVGVRVHCGSDGLRHRLHPFQPSIHFRESMFEDLE